MCAPIFIKLFYTSLWWFCFLFSFFTLFRKCIGKNLQKILQSIIYTIILYYRVVDATILLSTLVPGITDNINWRLNTKIKSKYERNTAIWVFDFYFKRSIFKRLPWLYKYVHSQMAFVFDNSNSFLLLTGHRL